jgi:alkylhydroperoxidase family enzyme
MALRLADKLAFEHTSVNAVFVARLREHFSEDELVDLGMSVVFLLGWGRFIEAFGILPDAWRDGGPMPWEAPRPGA